ELVRGARPDVFCFHAGTTKGGRTGFDSGETIAQTAARTEEAYRLVRGLSPETLLVAHGAAMETVEDAGYMLAHTSGHGFWTGSSTERLPIEKAVGETARRFAALQFGPGAPR
ncbi:MAG: phosphoenolpyruvate hydrolase family protein, partial [Planctomycetes bacterium]|nr:phosphoenolpyruvate hydrolase family protein [Planctomycetota bacterium]